MKDFFNEMIDSAKNASKVIAEKTMETVDLTKREIEIQKLKIDLNKEYKLLGKLMYSIEIGEIKRKDDIIENVCNRITEINKQLEDIKTERSTKDDPSYDEHDTEDMDSDQVIDMNDIVKPEKNEQGYFVMKFCNHCKVGNHPDAKKCINCGKEF